MTRSNSRLRTALAAAGVLLAAASVAQAQSQGTPEQRRACRKDAMKFCREFIPDVKRITACMEKNVRKLSPLCRTQFR
jgi:type II secretory pathway component PulL